MRRLAELIDLNEGARALVKQWIAEASVPVEGLPTDPALPLVLPPNNSINCQGNLEMSHREQFRNVTLVSFLGL